MHISLETLIAMYERNNLFLKRHLNAFNHSGNLASAFDGGPNAHWILGHLIKSRTDFLLEWRAPAVWSAEECRPFAAGEGPSGPDTPVTWEKLLEVWDRTHQCFMEALSSFTPERLQEEVRPGKNWTMMLEFFSWHEGYHIGQLALLKRGKGPVA
ncbi:DinB family protein [Deinococcus cellulosilyticus]|uniref:DinB-like domain-containing protein n=1 Tax=Deinococcus cellulosilyticus (strain DSM 18568 / NBRC 106333 / KACC 11606 / 5516J-15) TaxID=1223518 RepID=A0A511N4F4_DEIC1|nr:DinB family protein [Deinococcus cellulosilyticus]GEM47347.1 hypothetical protein DC3_29820 [Deinococcus cellulosilyticus NBRC 106333 = KACC 11606]